MRVVIIDDQPSMHTIMQRMLDKIAEVEIVGKFREAASAFAFLTANRADLVFLDIQMPGENGLELAKRLRESGLRIKLVFVTSHKDYALSAFDVYAYDYIVKPISQERLRGTVLRALSERGVHDEHSAAGEPLRDLYSHTEQVTKRELEVLQMVSRGLSNKEIAEEFDLSEGTIKNHLVHIFSKLQVKNRVQAATVAKELKIIP